MEAYDAIRNAIIEGTYEPGQRLTEEFLASELNISRTPIREAITRLETEGLVTPLKRGVIVRTYSKNDIKQIYDLRALLEGYAASQASLNRTDEDIKEMIETNKYFEKAIGQTDDSRLSVVKEVVRFNQRFHEKILDACNNEHIRFLISKVIVVPLVFRSFYWYDKQEMILSFNDHETIISAINNQDPDRARAAMMEHVFKGRDHVLKHFQVSEENENPEEESI